MAWRGRRLAVRVREEYLTVTLLAGAALEVAGAPLRSTLTRPRQRLEITEPAVQTYGGSYGTPAEHKRWYAERVAARCGGFGFNFLPNISLKFDGDLAASAVKQVAKLRIPRGHFLGRRKLSPLWVDEI